MFVDLIILRYAGAMGNASDELKQLVSTKGERSSVGGTVDENGILDILDYFGLASIKEPSSAFTDVVKAMADTSPISNEELAKRTRNGSD